MSVGGEGGSVGRWAQAGRVCVFMGVQCGVRVGSLGDGDGGVRGGALATHVSATT